MFDDEFVGSLHPTVDEIVGVVARGVRQVGRPLPRILIDEQDADDLIRDVGHQIKVAEASGEDAAESVGGKRTEWQPSARHFDER